MHRNRVPQLATGANRQLLSVKRNPIPLSANSYCVNDINYKPGDRVITKVKGAEVEATVVQVTIDIAVKTADGNTWWRAISRLRPATGELAGKPHTGGTEQPQPIMDAPPSAAPIESRVETTREEIFGEPAEATETQAGAGPTQSAGSVPEAIAQDKGNRRNRKRKR